MAPGASRRAGTMRSPQLISTSSASTLSDGRPRALQWNLHQLALALRVVADADSLIPALKSYPERYEAALSHAMLVRLGLQPQGREEDAELTAKWEAALAGSEIEPDRAFFDWRGGKQRGDHPAYAAPAFAPFREAAASYEPAPGALDHPYWSDKEALLDAHRRDGSALGADRRGRRLAAADAQGAGRSAAWAKRTSVSSPVTRAEFGYVRQARLCRCQRAPSCPSWPRNRNHPNPLLGLIINLNSYSPV